MSNSQNAAAPDPHAAAAEDLGPLAWVQPEIQKSLDAAAKSLARFARQGSIGPSADAASLQAARAQLHAAVGALTMVGHAALARVLGATEFAVHSFATQSSLCTPAAIEKIERAGFAVMDFIGALLAGKQVSPVALFPQYRDVLELVGNERIHPADLWTKAWRWVEMPKPQAANTLVYDPAVRSRLDREVLKVVRSGDELSAARLRELCLGLACGVDAGRARSFWALAGGFFEALAVALVPADVYVKRAASRVMLQYASLARGDHALSERLAQDLLFFCAQARPGASDRATALRAVRAAWGLTQESSVDYTVVQFGRYDPTVLAQLRKRVESAKEMWSALAGGNVGHLRLVADSFSQMSQSLQQLHPASQPLAQALGAAVEASLRSGNAPATELAMEVATAILYLEAAFEDLDPHDRQLTARTVQLAGRVDRARESGRSEPLEPWMEELYRCVSDRQTMGTVVDELRAHSAELEKLLDQYFRRPEEKGLLRAVPGQLLQMRGVFSVLGLEQAAQTVLRMRENVEDLLAQDGPAGGAGSFDSLGNNLGALGFLIDMLGYQPALAKRLFVFDQSLGELRPVMGRQAAAPEEASAAEATTEAVPVDAAIEAGQRAAATPAVVVAANVATAPPPDAPSVLSAEEVDAQIAARLAALAGKSKVAAPIEEFSRAADSWTAQISGAAPLQSMPDTEVTELDEEGLQDIFLEEAREVVGHGLQALDALRGQHDDIGALTVLRRAFHTLKGSSRMVGLADFGEAAWSFEQVLNTWLADQRPATPGLIAGSTKALQDFSAWAAAIGAGQTHDWRSSSFAEAAAALTSGESVPASAAVDVGAPETTARQVGPAPDVQAPIAMPALPSLELDDGGAPSAAHDASTQRAQEEADFDPFPSTDFLDIDGKSSDLQQVPPDLGVQNLDFLGTHNVLSTQPAQEEAVRTPDAEVPSEPVAERNPPAPEPLDEILAAEAGTEVNQPIEEDRVATEQRVSDAADSVEPEVNEDAVRVIGPLRIGIALYNVYLNEADEWSRQLDTLVGEWSLQPEERMPEAAQALAHQLAGSSSTVGFAGLSQMARLLEQALQNMHLHGGAPEHGPQLVRATLEVRQLLHQFAAGFLRVPTIDTLAQLHAIAAWELPMPAPVDTPVPDAADLPEPVSTPQVAMAPAGADVALESAEDAFDQRDSIDLELFPVFEEEATELLPQLGTALRDWQLAPQSVAPRAAILRTLHTLKGSARLAGAMQLGERAHRMESQVEALPAERASALEVEALLPAFDQMQSAFDRLRAADAQRQQEGARIAAQGLREQPQAAPAVEPASAALAASESPGDGMAAAPAPVVSPQRTGSPLPLPPQLTPKRAETSQIVRIRAHLLDRLVTQAGEVIITRTRLEAGVSQLRSALQELTGDLDRLRQQLRDVEVQAEGQMQSRLAQAKDSQQGFDPLEFDRFTRVQELTRMMAESVNDVATVQRTLQKAVQSTEDDLAAQAHQTRELQRGLLRTRMVEFEGITERLYRALRQACKDTGKQVRLDISGGSVEMDRGVLDRITPAFEHLLRNAVAHGIEDAAVRERAGKAPIGAVDIALAHEGNDVSILVKDDGAGLDVAGITERARALGLVEQSRTLSGVEAAEMIFRPGFSTAAQVSELAGRGIGMDVVRAEVAALGGRIETRSTPGQGTAFRLVLPLTTAVTHVVMVRAGELTFGIPSNLVELVQRVGAPEMGAAYEGKRYAFGGEQVPFYWAGALLQASAHSEHALAKHNTMVVVRSAAQRVALHVDEVLGNQEVVVKNLGPQLARLPGLAAISVLASGAVALIYNPVALAAVHGEAAHALQAQLAAAPAAAQVGTPSGGAPRLADATPKAPLVMVVDDSVTVRRVTQRLLQREGYRVLLANDGLQALERLQQERPALVLSDIEMPRMDGFDLARNIRADEALAGLPIIMITSRIAEKHREHARTLGVNHYLGKPYSEEELLRLVRGFTSQSDQAQAVAPVESAL